MEYVIDYYYDNAVDDHDEVDCFCDGCNVTSMVCTSPVNYHLNLCNVLCDSLRCDGIPAFCVANPIRLYISDLVYPLPSSS